MVALRLIPVVKRALVPVSKYVAGFQYYPGQYYLD